MSGQEGRFPAGRWALALGLGAVLMGVGAGRAHAVIKVDLDVMQLKGLSAQVLVGRVAAVDLAGHIVEVSVERDLRARGADAAMPKRVRVDLGVAADLVERIRVGGPAVVMVARVKGALIHVADTLVTADERATGDPPTWTATQKHEVWFSFPGQTSGLADCLEKGFRKGGGFVHRLGTDRREVLDLGAAPAFLAAGDFSGDGVPDLVACFGDRVRLLRATEGSYEGLTYEDVTGARGVGGVLGRLAAFGDANGDGAGDLLLDAALYVNGGGRFERSPAVAPPPDMASVVATALADATGDGRADAVFLTKRGELRVFENSGRTDAPWTVRPAVALWDPARVKPPTEDHEKFKAPKSANGLALAASFGRWGADDRLYAMVVRADGVFRYPLDGDGGPTDLDHLAGNTFKGSAVADLSAVVCVTALHLNNWNAKPDFYMVISPYPDLGLVNREYGCYFANTKLGDWRTRPLGAEGGWGLYGRQEHVLPVAITAADLDGDGADVLLFATRDGKLHVQDNFYAIRAKKNQAAESAKAQP